MPLFDLPAAELETSLPDREEPADFDAFWSATLARARRRAGAPTWTDVDAGYSELVTQDVRFNGFGGQEIRGWFVAPRHRAGTLPAVVSYCGYGGGRGLVGSWSQLPSAGVAQLVLDSCGQAAGTGRGTPPMATSPVRPPAG